MLVNITDMFVNRTHLFVNKTHMYMNRTQMLLNRPIAVKAQMNFTVRQYSTGVRGHAPRT